MVDFDQMNLRHGTFLEKTEQLWIEGELEKEEEGEEGKSFLERHEQLLPPICHQKNVFPKSL